MDFASRHPASFRDPSGFLFTEEGQLLRQVNLVYREDFDQLIESGLYNTLVGDGLLIPHEDVTHERDVEPPGYKILRPERIPFISYPYEWCFQQLKDAALVTLQIQMKSLEHGMSLKDCSAYNVQFQGYKPIFIDTLSFEQYREGEPWTAYRQFCQHFLGPLALMAYEDVRLSKLLRIYVDGLPLDLTSRLLPGRTRLNFSLLSHLHLHATAQARFSDRQDGEEEGRDRKVSRTGLLALIDNLIRAVQKLEWKYSSTPWEEYYSFHGYDAESLDDKVRIVGEFLGRINPNSVWDLGGNVGMFSRIGSDLGAYTVSMDMDYGAVEQNHKQATSKDERNLLPLVIDLTNPSPGIGWSNDERSSLIHRGPADTILALALMHHLAIGNNVPFAEMASFLQKIGEWLIIEFVPKDDPQVKRLLSGRVDIFVDYDNSAFLESFQRYFIVEGMENIQASGRILYLMKRH
ncbi:MAG: SAM-dependent methyltransferase [Anaerolineales bacterium]|nr:SAM-dependent methyltransferase [Anaerolineales bacterium]